jgi:hypothetical protein
MKWLIWVAVACVSLVMLALITLPSITGYPLLIHGRAWGSTPPDFARLKVTPVPVVFYSHRSPGNFVKQPSKWSNLYFCFRHGGAELRFTRDFGGKIHGVWWAPRPGCEHAAAEWGGIEPLWEGKFCRFKARDPGIPVIDATVYVLHE